MIRQFIIGGSVCLAIAFPAFAAGIDSFFGNTVVTTIDGAATHWTFESDGSFKTIAPNGQAGAGAWTLSGGELCVMPAGGDKLCTSVPPGKVAGDAWQATNSQGQSFQMSIVAGRKS